MKAETYNGREGSGLYILCYNCECMISADVFDTHQKTCRGTYIAGERCALCGATIEECSCEDGFVVIGHYNRDNSTIINGGTNDVPTPNSWNINILDESIKDDRGGSGGNWGNSGNGNQNDRDRNRDDNYDRDRTESEIICKICRLPINLCICPDRDRGGGSSTITINGNKGGDTLTVTIKGKTYYLFQSTVYTLKKTDKLCADIKKLNSFTDRKPSFTQSTDKTCVPTGMSYVSQLLGDGSITETSAWLKLVNSDAVAVKNLTGIGEWTSIDALKSEIAKELDGANLEVTQDVKDIKSFIDKGGAVLTSVCTGSSSEPQKDGTTVDYPNFHNVIATGYNENGIIIYDTNQGHGNYSVVPEKSLYNYSIGVQKNGKK